jgi:hypothetical protein
LLGLLQEGEGVAARILLDFDVDADEVRDQITGMLSDAAPRRQRTPRQAPIAHWIQWQSMLTGAALLGVGLLIAWALWG